MKVLSIFRKNLKTVSRTWSYFVVLFICPILLIFFAGLMLNSSDVDNIKIGLVDKDISYDIDLSEVKNVIDYDSLSNCVIDLTDSEIGTCIYLNNIEGKTQLNIYLDNTAPFVKYYSKQFILENIFEDQQYLFETTSGELNSKLSVYANSVDSAKEEMIQVRDELGIQEQDLINRRTELTKTKEEFDEVYIPLKQMQPEIVELREEIEKNGNNLDTDIATFRASKQIVENQISSIKNLLFLGLNEEDYLTATESLDDVSSSLNKLDSTLAALEEIYDNPTLLEMLHSYEEVIIKMDSLNQTLIDLDNDLEKSIEKTRESQERVDEFINELEDVSGEMKVLSNSFDTKGIELEFKDAYSISDDPIRLAFPLLISIIITFTSLILSNIFVLNEVNRPSYFREIISPTKDVNFLIADYLINLFFVFIQATVLFVIGIAWFELTLAHLPAFALVIFLTSSMFIFLGMSLGHLIKSQNLSMLLTIFYVMILLILSKILAPPLVLGPFVGFFISYSPFVILNDVLDSVLILNKSIISVIDSLVFLSIALFLSMVIVYISKKIGKEKIKH